jgi:glycosyltransferase involved in cell wall biosynthesis
MGMEKVRPGKERRLLMVVNHAGFFLSHRLPIALAAREAGFDVHVATPQSKHVPQILQTGLKWHSIALSRAGINLFRELETIAGLYRLYRELRPDIVHHVTSKPVLYGTIAARLGGVPAVVNAISGVGYVFTGTTPLHRLLRLIVTSVYRLTMRHKNMRVIFQNREHEHEFVRNRWVLAADAVLIPGSGADPDVFRPTPRGESPVVKVILASRMLYAKGIREFVAAARILRDRQTPAKLILVGEPDPANPQSSTRAELEAWDAEGIVEYRGRSEDMPAVMAGADIFCLPTYYGEGVPKVLIEAAASGLPIVTTDWPGCRDVVEDEVSGLLVPVRDPLALADALERLARDRDLRLKMGTSARAKAISGFSLAMVIDSTLEIYEELMS